MEQKNDLKKKLEKLLSSLDLEYEYIDIDEDINYLIHIKYSDSELEKSIGTIHAILFCIPGTNTITIGCTSLYKLVDSDSLLSTLIAINNANQKILYGKLFLRGSNNEISYYYKSYFNNIFEDLNNDNFRIMISSLLSAVLVLYTELRKIGTYEK